MRNVLVGLVYVAMASTALADGGPVEMRAARAEESTYFTKMAAAMEEALPVAVSGMVVEERAIPPTPSKVPVEFGKHPVRYRARVAWRAPEGPQPKPRTQQQIQADFMKAAAENDQAAMQRALQEMQAEASEPREDRTAKLPRASIEVEMNVRTVYVVKPTAVQAGPAGAVAFRTDDAGRSAGNGRWEEGSTVILLGRWTPQKTPAPYLNVYAKGDDSTAWSEVETVAVRVRADEATAQRLISEIKWPVLQRLMR